MGVVWGACGSNVGEEAVVEKRAFEEEMDQGVESVPDEQNAVFEERSRGQELVGEKVGREEDEEGGEERQDRGEINDYWRLGRFGCRVHNQFEFQVIILIVLIREAREGTTVSTCLKLTGRRFGQTWPRIILELLYCTVRGVRGVRGVLRLFNLCQD